MTLEERLAAFRPLFLGAFPGEESTFDSVAEKVRAEKAFIELSSDGKSFVILQPVTDLHVWTVGGDMAGILELEDNVSRRAAESGFDRMTALPSRDNWDRALRARGWKSEAGMPLVKEL